jgi:hypothetical protein
VWKGKKLDLARSCAPRWCFSDIKLIDTRPEGEAGSLPVEVDLQLRSVREGLKKIRSSSKDLSRRVSPRGLGSSIHPREFCAEATNGDYESLGRDVPAPVESKSTEKGEITTELTGQYGKLLSLCREVRELDSQTQAPENGATQLSEQHVLRRTSP